MWISRQVSGRSVIVVAMSLVMIRVWGGCGLCDGDWCLFWIPAGDASAIVA